MPSLFTLLSGAVLTASLFFGGGTHRGLMSDMLPELLSLPLLCMAAPRAVPILRETRFLSALLLGLVAIPLLQLMPLPPSVWSLLPGRGPIVAAYQEAGITLPWLALTLRPGETWRAFFALLPGLSLLVATLSLSFASRRGLVFVALAVGLLSIPIGILQMLGAGESPLDFFAGSGPPQANAAGFFANPNHFASFLAVLIPLTAAVFGGASEISPLKVQGTFKTEVPRLLAGGALIFAFVLGLALTGARSGLILGVLSLGATGVLIMRQQVVSLFRYRMAWVIAAILVASAIPVVLGLGLANILQRLQAHQVVEDLRWTFASVTWDALWHYFPFGSGLGSFEGVYQLNEPTSALLYELVNHAHNDWLEVGLEAGVLGMAVMLAWLVWLVRESFRPAGGKIEIDSQLGKAAVIGLWLLSLHALWDYPLRTVAVSAIFGFLVGLTKAPDSARHAGKDLNSRTAESDVRFRRQFTQTMDRRTQLPRVNPAQNL